MNIEEIKNYIWDLRENYHKTVQDLINKAIADKVITEEEATELQSYV